MIEARTKWVKQARPNQLPPDGDWFGWLLLAGRGYGKAVHVQELVPTPSGWTRMGEIKDGDEIFDETGAVRKVIKAHDVLLNRKCLKVSFRSGESLIVDEDHLWAVHHRNDRQRLHAGYITPLRVLKTNDIDVKLRYSTFVTKPLQLKKKKLLIHPYVFGAWLGDGASQGNLICGNDREVFTRIEECGYELSFRTQYDKNKDCLYFYIKGLRAQLREEGLLFNKHIPQKYLRGSIQQRLDLLRGLMDTDGCCQSSGTCVFTTTSSNLRDGMMELLYSLGVRGTLVPVSPRKSEHSMGWHIQFKTDFRVFNLERKYSRQNYNQASRRRLEKWYIDKIEPCESVPVRCLTVDSPSQLFLVGKSMVPTHNTRVGAEESWWMAASHPEPGYRHGVISSTSGDLRRTVFEGDSGLLACVPEECLWGGQRKDAYNRSNSELKLFNGSLIQGFSAAEPERLRGPQFHSAWMDELGAWGTANTLQTMQDAFDMCMFGLRLGTRPRLLVTTTPKPFPLVMDLVKRVGKDFVSTTGSSYENRENLAKTFFDQLIRYDGTQLGEQEIYAKIIDLESGGMYKRQDFELWPAGKDLPYFEFIVQSYDTAFTENTMNDPTACTTWGIFNNGRRYCAMLLDAWQEHMGMPELRERAYKEFNTYYGADAPVHDAYDSVIIKPGTLKNPLIGEGSRGPTGRKPDVVLIEALGSGISLIQELDRKGVPCRSYNPGKQDKALRGHVVSHLPPAGLIYIPESNNRPNHFVSWSEDLLYQLCIKRKPQWEIAPDDLFDTFTQAMRFFVDYGWLRVGDELSALMAKEGGLNNDRPAKRRNPYTS